MKKFLKIFGGFLVVLVALMIILPYVFKDKILERAKIEMNKAVDANIELGDISLSMFKSFPNLYLELEDIAVIGKNEFQGDTLVVLDRFYTAVNLSSLWSGEAIEVGAIVLDQARVNAIVLKDGKANWDIAKESSETIEEEKSAESEGSSDFKVRFEEVNVNGFSLLYDDASLKTRMEIANLDLRLAGDFSARETNLDLVTELNGVEVEYENVKYLKKAKMKLEAVIAANLENMVFHFKDNQLYLNDLEFGVDGSFGMKEDAYDLDLKLDARKTDFKTLLSMVPDVFKTDLKGLETSGNLALNAYVKGEYREDHLPGFGASLKVDNARFKYPDLPESVENIFVDVEVRNPGGDADNTVTDVNRFHVEIANNPFDATMHVKTPVSDPEIDGVFKGVIDFAKVKHAIPMDSVDIAGIVNANVSFNGKMSSIEKERYEDFMAKGDVKLKNFEFKTPDFPQGVRILNSALSFTPKYISLNSFDSRIGKSDVKLSGKIHNYIPYALKGQTLKGDFRMNSNWMDLNEFMSEEEQEEVKAAPATPGDTIPLSVIEIPANLDLKLVSNMKKIRFDKLDIQNVKGLIVVKNSVAVLKNLSMNMLQGGMTMNGSYSTQNVKEPSMDFGLDVQNFDIKSAYESLSMVKEMVPVAMNCEGKVSADLSIASKMDEEMSPKMKTLNGKGAFHSRKIIISDNKAFDTLAKLLKNDSYKRISLTQFDMKFLIKDGNVKVPPFKVKIAGHDATIYGTQSVEGNLDFTMDMKLPKNELGKEVNQYFDKLPGYDNVPDLDVAVKIGGTVSDPEVKLDLSKAIKQAQYAVKKELERRAKAELKKKGDKLKKELEKKLKGFFK
ncbi:MAG: AsmA-like C-terminal region-containing protein [Marinifilaceae bacterium]